MNTLGWRTLPHAPYCQTDWVHLISLGLLKTLYVTKLYDNDVINILNWLRHQYRDLFTAVMKTVFKCWKIFNVAADYVPKSKIVIQIK